MRAVKGSLGHSPFEKRKGFGGIWFDARSGGFTRPPPKREKDRSGKPVWSSAPGARTIRMCSLDRRSGTTTDAPHKREAEKSLAIMMRVLGNSTKPPARGEGRERFLLGYEKYLTR
jgi:hypothetical protein